MSKLSQLAGKPQKYLFGEIELEIKPLAVRDIDLFVRISSKDEKKQAEAMHDLIFSTLKAAVPDATNEEIDNISASHIETIMSAIMEVNAQGNTKKQQFLERIKNASSGTD
jgi:hypothetical protein